MRGRARTTSTSAAAEGSSACGAGSRPFIGGRADAYHPRGSPIASEADGERTPAGASTKCRDCVDMHPGGSVRKPRHVVACGTQGRWVEHGVYYVSACVHGGDATPDTLDVYGNQYGYVARVPRCGLVSALSSPRGERVVYIAAVATRLEAPGVVSPAHARHFRRGTRDGVHETLVRHRLAAHQLQPVLFAFDTDAAKRKGGEV